MVRLIESESTCRGKPRLDYSLLNCARNWVGWRVRLAASHHDFVANSRPIYRVHRSRDNTFFGRPRSEDNQPGTPNRSAREREEKKRNGHLSRRKRRIEEEGDRTGEISFHVPRLRFIGRHVGIEGSLKASPTVAFFRGDDGRTERIHADAKRGRGGEQAVVFLGCSSEEKGSRGTVLRIHRTISDDSAPLSPRYNNMRHGHTLNHRSTKDSADIHMVEWGPRDFNLSRFPRREY